MIDTICFTTSASLKRDFRVPDQLPKDWTAKACGAYTNDPISQKFILQCEPIGLRISGHQSHLTRVEVSLPKILWGHNAKLIKTGEAFTSALGWLNYILRSILDPLPPNVGLIPDSMASTPDCHYTRIDLPWHFPADSGVFIALSNARHGKIRSLPSLIKGQTVHLQGSFLEILVYDKIREMGRMKDFPYVVYRAEFRLKGKALSEFYRSPDGCGYTHLTFGWSRQVRRKLAMETHAGLLPQCDGNSIYDYVAYLESNHPTIEATNLYIHILSLKRESARKFTKLVYVRRGPPQATRTFAEFFPSGEWPAPPEVELPHEERQHWAWLDQYRQQFDQSCGGSI